MTSWWKGIVVAGLLWCGLTPVLASTLRVIDDGVDTLGFEYSGVNPDSCAPETARQWYATDHPSGIGIRLYFWDFFAGDFCFASPRAFAVVMSIREVCAEDAQCAGSIVDVLAARSDCLRASPRFPACLSGSQARPTRVSTFIGRPLRRTASGVWQGDASTGLVLTTQDATRSTLDSVVDGCRYAGRVVADVFVGAGTCRGMDRRVFALQRDANTLLNDVYGDPQGFRLQDAARRTIVEPGFPLMGAIVNPLTLGGRYLIHDPRVPARFLQIEPAPHHFDFAVLRVDGRYGGGIRCTLTHCELAFETGSGVVRRVLPNTDVGFETIYDVNAPDSLFAVRIGP